MGGPAVEPSNQFADGQPSLAGSSHASENVSQTSASRAMGGMGVGGGGSAQKHKQHKQYQVQMYSAFRKILPTSVETH